MKSITRLGLAVFVLFFIVATAYQGYEYQLAIKNADYLFSQIENESINHYYDSYEEEQSILENNAKNNQDFPVTINSETEPVADEDPLANLVVPIFTTGLAAYTFAEQVINLANGLDIEVTGEVVATLGITQTVKNIRKEDNDGNLYAYSSSYGIAMKVGQEMYYNKRQCKLRKTSAVSSDLTSKFGDATWTYSSLSTYKSQYGTLPNELNYIVNSQTVLSESNFKFENGKYTFDLFLNPETSTLNYRNNIKTTAGSSSYPIFDSVKLSVTILENGRFESICYNESYTISAAGFNTKINTNLLEKFNVIHGEVIIEVPSGF